MRKLLIIGIGAGDPDQMTVQAIAALNRADVIFLPDKGQEKAALRHLREAICARFIEKPFRSVTMETPRRAEAGTIIAASSTTGTPHRRVLRGAVPAGAGGGADRGAARLGRSRAL